MSARAGRRRALSRALVLLLGAGAAAACDSRRAAAPVGPRLAVDEASLRLGEVEQGSPLEFRLRLSNPGDAPLHLTPRGGAGACRAAGQPAPLDPGGAAELAIVCQSSSHGPFRAPLVLTSDDPASPHTFTLTASVVPRLAFASPTVELETRFGTETTRDVELVGTRRLDARVELAPLDAAEVAAELIPAASGAPPRVRLRLAGHRVGTHVGSLVLRTGLEAPRELTLHYRTVVRGTLTVTPTNPYFNVRVAEGRLLVLRAASEQEGFEVLRAQVLAGPFAARVLGPTAGLPRSFDIEISVVAPQLTPDQRGVSGRLRLVTTDRTEPEREVPLVALGKVGAGDPRSDSKHPNQRPR